MPLFLKQTFRLYGLLICVFMITSSIHGSDIVPDSTFDTALIKPRVNDLDFFVRTRYNSDTERHIRGFVLLARKNAQRILGESTIYFPIIEKKCAELGLPDDLKYLTVVESMLKPKAESYAGAKGMWQIMPHVAEDYNITINDFKDERFHVEKSAFAGLSYLKKLYGRFGNWELALAAYNCGTYRVKRILKQTGKTTYWGIRHLLPRQTREFVPKLTAVKYLFEHYQNHNLQPVFPSMDMQLTRAIEINAGKTYKDLAEMVEITEGVISFLNPSHIYEPSHPSMGKIELILPSRVANAVVRHMEIEEKHHNMAYRMDSSSVASPYHKVIYAVPDSMSLATFCADYNLSISQVWLWNELSSDDLIPGQELFVYQYQELLLEYKLQSNGINDIKVSRLDHAVSLLDTLSISYGGNDVAQTKGQRLSLDVMPE